MRVVGARLLPFLVLAGLLASPLAGGNYVLQGRSPWEAGYMMNPQMYCMVLFDAPETQECHVRGPVKSVEIVRVRILGSASVHVSVVDMRGPINGHPEQRAIVDCAQSCIASIPSGQHTDDDWAMWVTIRSPGGSFVSVSLEHPTQITPTTQV